MKTRGRSILTSPRESTQGLIKPYAGGRPKKKKSTYVISDTSLSIVRPDRTVLIMTTDDDRFAFEVNGLAARFWIKLSQGEKFQEVRSNFLAVNRNFEVKLDQFVAKLLKFKLIQKVL